MVLKAFGIIAEAFSTVALWFLDFLSQDGLATFYLSAVFLVLVGKFLLTPLFGSAGSDKARKRKDDSDV